jgi:hypothetical protein
MESVETVLETYGEPEEDWKDTYGARDRKKERKREGVCVCVRERQTQREGGLG